MKAPMDNQTRAVFDEMEKGLPPSLIDAKLHLPAGRAKETVVNWWRYDKALSKAK